MLNHCMLPSRCHLTTLPLLRPYGALIPFLYKPNRSVAAFTTREKVLVRQREGEPLLKTRIGSAKTLNEKELKQGHYICAGQSMPVLDSKSPANLYRIRKRRWARGFPTQLLTEDPSQERIKAYVERGCRWRLCRRRSDRRGGGIWVRRLGLIRKSLRLRRSRNSIRRWHDVSFALWPEYTSWSSKSPTTGSIEEINLDWTSDFLSLNRPKARQKWSSLDTEEVMQKWTSLDIEKVMRGNGSLRPGPRKKRMGSQRYDGERLWRNVMLWCLKYRKRQALQLLLATFKRGEYRPPRYVVSDCLDLLAHHFLYEFFEPDQKAMDTIWFLTCKFIDGARNQDQKFPVPQHLVYLILRHSDDSRVLAFYGLLGLNKAFLHVNTMLHFLDRFIDMGRINESLKILGNIADTNFSLSSDRVQMACVKLLRARFDTQEYAVRSNILANILEMGIRPKVPMLNAILLNAGEGGDFASAWKMYGVAKENALIPDTITHGVLLKGAKLSGISTNLELVIHEVQTHREVLPNAQLVSSMLDAIYLMSPRDAFHAMLDFYKQHFDLRPLKELALCGEETLAPPDADCCGFWPNSYILTQMILAYVKLHEGEHSLDLVGTYNLYYQHVKENHPLIAPLAQKDFVANVFIKAFGKKSSTLLHCTTVVKDMFEFSSPHFSTFDSVPYAAPTVQTWSILVHAYFLHGQRRAAEKVLDMMRELGIERDKAAWNTIISGYIRLQEMSAGVDTAEQMVAKGFKVETYTTKGLRCVRGSALMNRLRKVFEPEMEEPLVNKGANEGLVSPLNKELVWRPRTELS